MSCRAPGSGHAQRIRQTVEGRLEEQAHSHWTEFAVIFASADVLLALGSFGASIMAPLSAPKHLLALLIAAASTASVILGYYSIRLGSSFAVGPVQVEQVLSSFLISAAQIALFLWPLHVLRDESVTRVALDLRWWFLAHASFCTAAVAASAVEASIRRREGVHHALAMQEFEYSQYVDRLFAAVIGYVSGFCFAVTMRFPQYALRIEMSGAVIVLLGMVAGIASQAQLSRRLSVLHRLSQDEQMIVDGAIYG